jgi:hypothetical protein
MHTAFIRHNQRDKTMLNQARQDIGDFIVVTKTGSEYLTNYPRKLLTLDRYSPEG